MPVLEPLCLRTKLSSSLRSPLVLCESQFRASINDWVKRFPAGQYQVITLKLIAAAVAFGKATFTFTFNGGNPVQRGTDSLSYGKWKESRGYTTALINDIMQWLLDENRCFTEWDVLLSLREQHSD